MPDKFVYLQCSLSLSGSIECLAFRPTNASSDSAIKKRQNEALPGRDFGIVW